MKRKTVIIGLDGASPRTFFNDDVLHHLPNIRNIIQYGARAKLETIMPMNTAPAWTSFATGVNPGKHGVYFFFPS